MAVRIDFNANESNNNISEIDLSLIGPVALCPSVNPFIMATEDLPNPRPGRIRAI